MLTNLVSKSCCFGLILVAVLSTIHVVQLITLLNTVQ